jgi:hypothetical protein
MAGQVYLAIRMVAAGWWVGVLRVRGDVVEQRRVVVRP